jgi:hypothetical protein
VLSGGGAGRGGYARLVGAWGCLVVVRDLLGSSGCASLSDHQWKYRSSMSKADQFLSSYFSWS